MKVELKQLIGVVIGGPIEEGAPATIAHDMDEIWLEDFQGVMRKVGHISHADGASCNFFRILDTHRGPVRDEVAKLREARGLKTSELTSQPPNPALMKKLLAKGAKS